MGNLLVRATQSRLLRSSTILWCLCLGLSTGTASAMENSDATVTGRGSSVTLVGSANLLEGQVRLTRSIPSQVGAAWLTDQVDVASGFTASFTIKITNTGGDGADGFAFVIQNSSVTAIGAAGGAIGYGDDDTTPQVEAIPNSLAVEFDTYQNPQESDPNANHVSVHSRGVLPNDQDEAYSLGWTTNIPNLSDGKTHRFVIDYVPGTLTIMGGGYTLVTISVDLSTLLSLNGGKAWAGFTGATGAATENHYILHFAFN